jgi:ribosomal protection tetracycline resistance protein
LVLANALSAAQTVVCEPVDHFRLEIPTGSLNGILTLLAKSGATTKESVIAEGVARVEGKIASAMVQSFQQQMPGLSSGEGILECAFNHHAPTASPYRARKRSGADPYDRADYLQRLR